uniref:(S)-2-hydroxy-acid oxidase n=1 Tax=Amblyomma maculatum TaxID=34609 RepID=G3MPB4_AMBMU
MKLGPALLLLTCCVSHGVSVDDKRTVLLSSTAERSGNSSSPNSKSENVSGRRSAAAEGRSESSPLQVESSKRHVNAQLPFGLNIPHGSQPNYAFAPDFGGGFFPAANGAGPFGVKFDRGQALFPGRNGRLDPGIDQSFSTGHNGNQFSDQGLIPPVGPESDADGTSPPVLAAVPGGRPRPDGSSRAKVPPIELFPSPDVVTVTDIEKLGDAKLERTVRGYYDSGADREQTLRENVEAFSRLRFRPRVLVDVSRTSTSTTVLGREISMPIGIAPSAMQKLADPIGEVGTAKAAEAAGTVMILSTLSTTSLEEVRKNAPNCLLWYQLYVYRNRSLTESLVKRAAKAGYSALVLTVDAPVFGLRIADVKNRFSLPPGLKLANLEGSLSSLSSQSGSGLTEYTSRLFNPSVTWEDVPWLRSISGLPVVIKGIVTPEAAVYAQTYGAAAVLVSNHGGRQLDGAPATIEALPEIVAATRGRMEVYMDGGVRSGADAVKALCLGARAVFVGRPALWGLAYNGTEGVARMLDILRSEFERTIALLGVPDSTKLTPRYVVREEYYSQLNWRNFPRQEL